jgi:cytochrome c
MRGGAVAVLALAGAVVTLKIAVAADNDAGDPVAGRVLFQKCQNCHSPDIGVNKIGPSLWGVVGRRAASVPDYMYSDTMRNATHVWNAAALDIYLADPRHVLKGTRMMFQGLPDPRDRADVIAYLGTLD